MPSSNVTIFNNAIKKAKVEIAKKLMKDYFQKAVVVVNASKSAAAWRNFTGNAITSFVASGYSPLSMEFREYSTLKSMKAPIHSKVNKGEYLLLSPDYDSNPYRSVIGEVDIYEPWSADSISYIRNKPRKAFGMFLTIRLGHPVEYEQYLKSSFGFMPIIAMRNFAMLGLK